MSMFLSSFLALEITTQSSNGKRAKQNFFTLLPFFSPEHGKGMPISRHPKALKENSVTSAKDQVI